MDSTGTARRAHGLRPWSFVLAFGLVSLLADMVYEGARSIIGPYLATLGASATVVGLAAGAGEFIGYGLRVASGYLVRRRGRYWAWTLTGYTLTVLSVPLIAVTGALAPALLLYGTERLGKAVRAPAKDTLLSHASARTGRGIGFGVHQAMDQTGAVAGPLLLAAILAASQDDYRLAFATLAIPGALALGLLIWLRVRVPHPESYEEPDGPSAAEPAGAPEPAAPPEPGRAAVPAPRRPMPPLVREYVLAVGILSAGVASFPLLAFHAVEGSLLTEPRIPLLFALAMAVDGASGLLVGHRYDRRGHGVLLIVPVAAALSALAFTDRTWALWVGVGIWGAVNGILDSTVKAVVTDLVPGDGRAVAFGWLSFARGIGLLVAGGVLGAVYDTGPERVIVLIVLVNVVAFGLLTHVLRRIGPLDSVTGR